MRLNWPLSFMEANMIWIAGYVAVAIIVTFLFSLFDDVGEDEVIAAVFGLFWLPFLLLGAIISPFYAAARLAKRWS